MRLFLAVNLPEDLKKRLFVVAQGLTPFGKLKLVEEENIHLTLKFLGEAEPEPVVKAMESVRTEPFRICIGSMGVFPSDSYIRVVWAGCDEGFDKLKGLHDEIEKALPQFKKDKDFHPHATLARVKFPKDKKGLIAFVNGQKSTVFGKFDADSFQLMESKLSRKGPEYSTVKSFPL